jgi:hypothetical protein
MKFIPRSDNVRIRHIRSYYSGSFHNAHPTSAYPSGFPGGIGFLGCPSYNSLRLG